MHERYMRFFTLSAGVTLLLTASAKLVTFISAAKAFTEADPIFLIPLRYVLLMVGILEVGVATVCFLRNLLALQAYLVAWLATVFLAYRIGLSLVGFDMHCPCLGNLTSGLHISPTTADWVMKLLLAYLLVGSFGCFLKLRMPKGLTMITSRH